MKEKFKFIELKLDGAYLIEYYFAEDNRGTFSKYFEKNLYEEIGLKFNLNECFTSVSAKNVIRGLHYQTHNSQAKLVSVPRGKVYDVIVDLRQSSSTFKQWQGFELSDRNHLAIYVPRGFAHGFASLEDNTIMLYQCDGAYDKETDTGIRFDDPDIGIIWPVEKGKDIHSARDLDLMSFKQFLTTAEGF